MAINFPSGPSVGDPFEYLTPEGFIINYIWDGQKWVVQRTNGLAVGDLQQVTDVGNITTNGADFGGNVRVGADPDSQTAVGSGYGYARYEGNNVWFGYGDGGIYISDDDDTSAANIKLKPNGSATFASTVKLSGGRMIIRREGDISNVTNFISQHGAEGSTTNTLSLLADGTLNIGTNVSDAATRNIILNPDGSASFAGPIEVNTTKGGTNVARFESSGANSYGILIKAGGEGTANYYFDVRTVKQQQVQNQW